VASSIPGRDYPETKAVVDIQIASREDLLISWVEAGSPTELTLTVAQDRAQRRIRLDVGETLHLLWNGPDELRAMPAELIAVKDDGDEQLWHLRPLAPATRGQRRNAVRVDMTLPLSATTSDGTVLSGTTLNLSEHGLLGLVELSGRRPEVGDVLTFAFDVEPIPMSSRAEVIRAQSRPEGRIELAVRFIGLPERHQDLIRARVFAELRTLRSRGLI
jgi:hypothetical protein